MNFFPRSLLLGIAFAASATLTVAAAEPQAAWEAPPGWTETRGGAGGNVLRVTTLDASGPGSLAEAIATSGARTIEFAVAGDIDLGWNGLKITEPYLTIAGETAPSPGITLTHGGVVVGTHDVIIRHIRIRPSDGPRSKPGDRSVDSLTTAGGACDVIVDHCSFAWGTDENLSASGPRFNGATPDDWRKNTSHRITFSNCIVGEGVHESNPKGTLVHDNASDIAIIGNLYVSHGDRHPLFKGGARAAAVNNLIHNPGRRVMQYGFVPAQWTGHEVQSTTLTMVGNVARKGPSSAAEIVFFEIWPTYGPCDFYLEDNLLLDAAGKSLPAGPGFRDKNQLLADAPQSVPAGSGFQFRLTAYQTSAEMRWVAAPPLWPPRLKARPASETTAWVLANAGARPWDRDALDRRLVEEARSGGGKIIAIKSEAGGPR